MYTKYKINYYRDFYMKKWDNHVTSVKIRIWSQDYRREWDKNEQVWIIQKLSYEKSTLYEVMRY